jgi:hypothetical protein
MALLCCATLPIPERQECGPPQLTGHSDEQADHGTIGGALQGDRNHDQRSGVGRFVDRAKISLANGFAANSGPALMIAIAEGKEAFVSMRRRQGFAKWFTGLGRDSEPG